MSAKIGKLNPYDVVEDSLQLPPYALPSPPAVAMVGSQVDSQDSGFQWVKWSNIGWPRLVDIPPERRTTWFAPTTPNPAKDVVNRTRVESPSQGDGAADGRDEQEETVPDTVLPEGGNHTTNNSSSRLADFVGHTTGSAPATLAGVDAAGPLAELDSGVEGAPDAPVAAESALLAEPAASANDAKLSPEVPEDPGYVGDAEVTPERAPSVLEENPPTQAEEPAPSPAEPAKPKEDDAKTMSSASSEHTVQPLSEVAKGKRKCVDFASSEEDMPFNSSHQRSFPLVRNKSPSGLQPLPPGRTRTSVPPMGVYEEGEPSRPSRSTLEAVGLRDSEWDDSVHAQALQFALLSDPAQTLPEPIGDVQKPTSVLPDPAGDVQNPADDLPKPHVAVPEPVGDVDKPAGILSEPSGDVPKPVVASPDPVGDVTGLVQDQPTPAGTPPKPVGSPPTMSGALPVPDGSQPEPIDTAQPAEVPKVKWTSLLLRKLRNLALPRPILMLLLGREVADQVKPALELLASGAAA